MHFFELRNGVEATAFRNLAERDGASGSENPSRILCVFRKAVVEKRHFVIHGNLKKTMAAFGIAGAVCAVFAFPVFAAPSFKDADTQFKKVAGSTGAGLSTESNPEKKIAQVVQVALSLVGIVFFILMLYGGFIWMTARGDDTQAKKAKDIIVMATIGMAVILLAYAATYLVIGQVFTAPK